MPSDSQVGLAPEFVERLRETRGRAVAALLAAREPSGPWVGELSCSALATATAVMAFTLLARNSTAAGLEIGPLIRRGLDWLATHTNPDGGWGDSPRSRSNISTTTLVWAAICAQSQREQGLRVTQNRAEAWLRGAAGSLEPEALVRAITARYGRDRTFSVPILTVAALSGRLGPEGWRWVRQLPFELAVLPHQWFGALRLPVVSYALPALIAIGQVRHHFRPSRNRLTRALRNAIRSRTLTVLESLQPRNGGFLEATPLTSFVTMSLAAMGLTDHPVLRRGVQFLIQSVRSDGSWPIDTNLSTWLTTLSLEALVSAEGNIGLSPSEREVLRQWLLRQQYRSEHPYTHAAPGGWAWTDLPGGVPDADDTAGALLALRYLGEPDAATCDAATAGVRWLLDLQNRDGGIPTFCRGWGTLPFDRSSPDLTAHAIRAWLVWRGKLGSELERRLPLALERAIAFLSQTQGPDGAWVPLWFGNQSAAGEENPVYGTSRVLLALAGLPQAGLSVPASVRDRAVDWLLAAQHPNGGWGGDRHVAPSVEETAWAVAAIGELVLRDRALPEALERSLRTALQFGADWLTAQLQAESWPTPTPVGLYFARLWYAERLYPLLFSVSALNRTLAGSAGKACAGPPRPPTCDLSGSKTSSSAP